MAEMKISAIRMGDEIVLTDGPAKEEKTGKVVFLAADFATVAIESEHGRQVVIRPHNFVRLIKKGA